MQNPCINCKDQWYAGRGCACHYMCDRLEEWRKQEKIAKKKNKRGNIMRITCTCGNEEMSGCGINFKIKVEDWIESSCDLFYRVTIICNKCGRTRDIFVR